MEEQRQEIQRLKLENRRLYRELEELQKQLETMNYVHSIDDLIDTMREEKPKASNNPFAIFANGGSTGSGTDSGTHADKMLSPDNFEGVVPDADDEIISTSRISVGTICSAYVFLRRCSVQISLIDALG